MCDLIIIYNKFNAKIFFENHIPANRSAKVRACTEWGNGGLNCGRCPCKNGPL